ncbi:ABC transporter permease [Thermococcus sp.]
MKLRAIKGIIIKDLKELRREKMALFWIFIFPLMWITLFGTMWGGHNPPISLDVGVVYTYTNESSAFTAYDVLRIMENVTLEGVHVFKIREFSKEESGINALKHGKIDSLIVFPSGFGRNVSTGRQAKIYIYFDRSDPQQYQIVRGTVMGFFSEMEKKMREKRIEIQLKYMEAYIPKEDNISPETIKEYLIASAEPLEVEEKEVSGKSPTPIQFYITSFIGIQFLFATMLTIGTGTLEEIEKGTLRRIAASPATAWDFLTGKMLSTFLIIMVSIFVGLGYAKLVFGETIVPSPLGWLIIFIASIFSMSLGLTIAMATRSIKSTTAVVNFVSMPLLFLAGIVIPESIVPSWARPIANYFALGRALKEFRLLEIYHRPVSEIMPGLVLISIETAVVFLTAIALYKWAIKRLEA